jgi:hypothetical protein
MCASSENLQKFEAHAEDVVRALYRALLNRDPDPEEAQHYGTMILEPGGLEKVISCLIESQKFQERRLPALMAAANRGNADFTAHDLEEPKLVFLHIPKTGGQTLHNLLLPHFAPEVVCPERFNGLRHFAAG